MWNYEKRLEYPIKIKQTNPTLAAMIISQYGGPDGELGASIALHLAKIFYAIQGSCRAAYRYRH